MMGSRVRVTQAAPPLPVGNLPARTRKCPNRGSALGSSLGRENPALGESQGSSFSKARPHRPDAHAPRPAEAVRNSNSSQASEITMSETSLNDIVASLQLLLR